MKQIRYNRVSTEGQNADRQIKIGMENVLDTCSGSIAFFERTHASKLKDLAFDELHVHSIDRLGRSTLDIMQTIQYFTNKGICVISEKEGLKTLIDGKPNPIASLLIGVLGSIAEFELNRIKERQKEGIANAKAKGVYKGRYKNAKEDEEKFLSKYPNVIKKLQQGQSIRSIANDKRLNVSTPTIVKIKRAIGL
jgi:DNA invertase Pin-like site-specific DNA recombinase